MFLVSITVLPTCSIGDIEDDIAIQLCSSPEYIQCLNITNKSCTKTYKAASTNCYSYHDIENIDYDSDISVFKEFGECVITEFIKYNAIQKQKFEKCDHFIQTHFQKYVEQARIQSKEYDKKFFEEDDHLHSNQK